MSKKSSVLNVFCCLFCCQSYSIQSSKTNCKQIKTLEELVPSTATLSTETWKALIYNGSIVKLEGRFPFFPFSLKIWFYCFLFFFSEFIFLSVFFYPHFSSALTISRNLLCNLQTLPGGHGHKTKRDYYLSILIKSGNLIKSSLWNCLYLWNIFTFPLPPVSLLTTILLFSLFFTFISIYV